MDDAWNEKIPAQCTRNTKRVLQPALCCTVLWVVCSLGRGVCIFWKAPGLQDMYKSKQKTEWKKKKSEISPDTQEHLQCKTGALFPTSVFPASLSCQVLHVWGGFCSPHLSCLEICNFLLQKERGKTSPKSALCISPWPWHETNRKIKSYLG